MMKKIEVENLVGLSLHFNVTHQRTTTGPGIQTVLRNVASLLSARRPTAGQYLFFEPLIAGDLQSCQTVPDI